VSGAVDVSKIYVTQALNEVLTRAEEEAEKLKDEFMSVEHLFLALIHVGKPAALKKYFEPNQTLMIEIQLERHIADDLFTLTQDLSPRKFA
jgi:ATP-dependent Clp protease ATP-binding subunit ClpA